MIAITLNFRTIEAARQVLLEIPASFLVQSDEAAPAPKTQKAAATPAAAETKAAKPAPVGESPSDPKPAAAVSSPSETAAVSPASSPAATASAPAVEYPVLQKAVFALAGKSRDAAAAVAASFGVKTFKELDASKWADALAAVNAKLAEV